jgi:hypothetical protein
MTRAAGDAEQRCCEQRHICIRHKQATSLLVALQLPLPPTVSAREQQFVDIILQEGNDLGRHPAHTGVFSTHLRVEPEVAIVQVANTAGISALVLRWGLVFQRCHHNTQLMLQQHLAVPVRLQQQQQQQQQQNSQLAKSGEDSHHTLQ